MYTILLFISRFFCIVEIMEISEILTRNIETILPSKESLEVLLRSGKKLRVKFGIDPTGPRLHIGHAIPLWKLREFQELGHTVILLFGDFTARIGDPSDKTGRRPMVGEEEIKKNVKGYLLQVKPILKIEDLEVRYNSEWHNTLTEADLLTMARLLTVNQMLARRNFAARVKEKKEIGIDEFLYPLLQGYDSVALNSDIELGGADQLFNLEAGRIVQEAYSQNPQCVITTKMLIGLDGEKMSKSRGNVVNITDSPQDMFGKIMSVSDDLTMDYARLATRLSKKEIEDMEAIKNPKEQKERLALELVKLYSGEEEAKKAQKEFERVFVQKKSPSEMVRRTLPQGTYTVIDILLKTGLAPSKNEARRLVDQKGITIGGNVANSPQEEIRLDKELIITKGKRMFIKVVGA